jgi:hypothetical protein
MTTPLRLADRISALVGSVDLSGFTPFFAPVMFFFNEYLWPTWLWSHLPRSSSRFSSWPPGAGMHDRSAIRSNDSYADRSKSNLSP